MAEDQGDKGIAIILSGNGSDGTKGIAAVKKEGGMVIVQDPNSTTYNSMPNSAIASGNYDFVLPPKLIPQQIINYIDKRKSWVNNNDPIADIPEVELVKIINLIKEHSPLDFSEYKTPTIVRRIIRRMQANKSQTTEDYIKILNTNPTEIETLSKEFLISVTKFFRDEDAFNAVQKLIPDLIENKLLVDTLKVWVVGCATGEEAYSIAILIKEYLISINKQIEVKIFASDIDKDALAVASKGIYAESIKNDVSEERLSKYFYHEDGKYRIKESIRNMLIVAHHDITQNPPYYKLDFISCRNLLIYLNPVLQKKILTTLHFCLNPDGYLFLGPSEGLGDLKTKFLEENRKWKIYKNNEPSSLLENGIYTAPNFYNPIPLKKIPVLNSTHSNSQESLNEVIMAAIAQKTDMAGVCVDEDYKIIKTFGEYKKYLLPEMFNFALLQMLPHELSLVTSTALNQVTRQKKEITIKDVIFTHNEVTRSINIFIKPLTENKLFENILLVCFSEQAGEQKLENTETYNKDLHASRYLFDVQEDLKNTKIKLNESYEQLEASNINAQTYSEELISNNEELQSTNEEVQSINEELQTVNNLYQLKIKELSELNDDLNNYFKSTVNGHIYLDKNFIIRKFSPSAFKQINVKDSDIGRPLGDISTNIKFSRMIDDIRSVLTSSHSLIKEVETQDSKWYQMMVVPYIRQQDNIIDGAIISFNDITDLKIAEKKLLKINEDHNTFIFAVSHDLLAPVANIEGLISTFNTIIGPGNEKIKEMADLMNVCIKRLKDTIVDLSDLRKIEKEYTEERPGSIYINELLNEIKLSIKETLVKSKTKITTNFSVNEVYYSKKNLRSILLNLITNAIKYKSPERDPEIKISTKKEDSFIILSVEDNGKGISKEDQEKIFNMYKRVDIESEIEGTGIGLFLIKKIVTNTGGKIEVESEKGKGSVFKVWLKK